VHVPNKTGWQQKKIPLAWSHCGGWLCAALLGDAFKRNSSPSSFQSNVVTMAREKHPKTISKVKRMFASAHIVRQTAPPPKYIEVWTYNSKTGENVCKLKLNPAYRN
jgi:hypothetical protein